MIFIGGVHGVGKSYFCSKAESELSIVTYSASELISERKKFKFSNDKLIPDIDENQQYLLLAIDELNSIENQYILDGHFCLLNSHGDVTRIPISTFQKLQPDAVIILTSSPDIIAERRRLRDGMDHSVEDITRFQNEEINYATKIANELQVPFFVSLGEDDLDKTLDFIRVIMRR
jgi:adenylate kinase